MPQYNNIIRQFQDKPVVFFAVAAGDTIQQAKAYVGGTRMAMPAFADALSLMERRYGQTISLSNIHQYRVIDPDGKICGNRMDPATIEAAIARGAEWKYRDKGYHKSLEKAVNLLEFNQYEEGVKALKPMTKRPKEVGESAKKLYAEVKAEGQAWLKEAESSKESDPVKAFDLYTRVGKVFKGEDFAKTADAAARELRNNKTVRDELDARKMWGRLTVAMSQNRPDQSQQVGELARSIATRYPETPTGKRAGEIATELGVSG